MNLEHKKRVEQMHDSLVMMGKDGQAEHVLDPLPGQMPFAEIMRAKENDLDAYIAANLPSGVRAFKKDPFPKNDRRRTEVKRLVLARLMGFGATGDNIQDSFDYLDPAKKLSGGRKLAVNLDVQVSNLTTKECKERIKDVRLRAAREAGALVLTLENQKIMDSITRALNERGLQSSPPLTQLDILNVYALPRHEASASIPQTIGKAEQTHWDISMVLHAFFLSLTMKKFTPSRLAERLRVQQDSLRAKLNSLFSEEAKEILRKAHEG